MEDFTEQIDNAIDVLNKLDKQSPKKNLLSKDRIIYLQVVIFRIPFVAPRKRRFLKLVHSLYGDDPEICLFVPNRKTGVEYKKTTDELIDYCVDYYTELLEKHKVKGIKTIMPLKQLRSEYGTYDLKRKLVRRFDLFLCKNSLLYNSRFLTSLGKIFRVANKDPLGVPFPKEDSDFDPDFQKNIERAIFTSSFYITRFSDNYSIPFGLTSHSKKQLKENLQAVLKQILNDNVIPGGIKNIRAMHVWPSQSKPIPLFLNPEIPTDTKMPQLKTKKKRKLKGVQGELSTQPYKKVCVMPSGEVFVTKIKKRKMEKKTVHHESGSEDSFNDDSDGEAEKEVKEEVQVKQTKDEEESEDDEEIEKKEAKLMKIQMKSGGGFSDVKPSKESDDSDDDENDEKEEEEEANFAKKQNKFMKNSNKKELGKKKNKSKKLEGNKKINKTKRKTLIKQEKFKLKEKMNEKKKGKAKKGQKS